MDSLTVVHLPASDMLTTKPPEYEREIPVYGLPIA
jgi:hypothetical protein